MDKYSFTPTHTCTHVFLVGFLLILGSILENVADSCSRLPPDYYSATAGSQIRSFFQDMFNRRVHTFSVQYT